MSIVCLKSIQFSWPNKMYLVRDIYLIKSPTNRYQFFQNISSLTPNLNLIIIYVVHLSWCRWCFYFNKSEVQNICVFLVKNVLLPNINNTTENFSIKKVYFYNSNENFVKLNLPMSTKMNWKSHYVGGFIPVVWKTLNYLCQI